MTDLTADVKSRSSTERCLLCWKSETGDRHTTGIEAPTEFEDDYVGCL
jgi:hypothetical protein